MRKLSGKVVEAKAIPSAESEPCIGQRLRELRMLAGLTQVELAARLRIGQTALSKLEKRADIQVSTLKTYVEALGATLRIDAAFDTAAAVKLSIVDVFEESEFDDNQLILPILAETKFRAHRDIVLSIKPTYSSMILDGRKKVELRRRFPATVPGGTLAFIYSTSPDRAMVGTARIKRVLKKPVPEIWSKFSQTACVKRSDFDNYFSGSEDGYVLQFENAQPLRRTVNLQELRERFNFEPPQSFLYAKPILREVLAHGRSEIPH